MPRSTSLAAMFACAVMPLAAATAADDAADDAAEKARALLKSAAAHLAKADGFRMEGVIDYEIKVRNDGEALSSEYTLVFERPDKLFVRLNNDAVEFRLVAANDTVTTYISEFDAYTVDDETPFNPSLVQRSAFGPLAPVMLILSEFVEPAPFSGLLDGATGLTHAGRELVGGESVDRVRFTRDDMTFDVWIAAEGDPLVRRIVPDTSAMLSQFQEQGVEASMSVNADLKTWTFGKAPADAFVFSPPEGVEQVASFQAQPSSPAQKLLGKAAPGFTLPLLDGGTLDLAAAKGKEIIVLDFWATWCGPCRQAMPVIDRVTGKFAGKGVRLYAVNLRETPTEIKEFLQGQRLDLPVALDKDGAVAGLYNVEGIPQTVIIGKDGTVQVIHEGMSPALEAELTRELTALANGETLAP